MLELKTLINNDIDDVSLNEVISLKEQHWSHGKDSQRRWIRDNLHPQDIHCLLFKIDNSHRILVGYLNIVTLHAEFDGFSRSCLGIGNVCIDKRYEHKGLGRQLIIKVNALIEEKKMAALLLCKENVVGFYRKSGWKKIRDIKSYIGTTPNNNIVMVYNISSDEFPIRCLSIDRSF